MMAARSQMKDQSSLSAYAAVLLALTLLFFVRVLAQALVAFFEILSCRHFFSPWAITTREAMLLPQVLSASA
jgi:hypothetical protein